MVQADSFSFDGVDMLTRYGIRCIAQDVLMPRLRPRKVVIPGRDGAYDFGARDYEEREVMLTCDTLRQLTRMQLRELAHLLSRKGRLVLAGEDDKYYIGRLYDPAAIGHIGRAGHVFTLAFLCEPFAIGETVAQKLDAGGAVDYAGTARTPVRLTVQNTGTAPVTGVRLWVRRLA